MKRTLIVALLATLLLTPPTAWGQDPAFVGVLALAVDAKGAKELGLSDEVKKQLDDLIKKREDEILQLGVDQLPDDEQKAKLAAFVTESEKQGLALLTKEQQAKLMQMKIARGGLSTLADADVAEKLGLDEKKRSNIAKMLASLKPKLTAGTEEERRIAKAALERGLGMILSKEERAAWEKLAGLGGAGPEKPAEVVVKAEGAEEEPAAEAESADEKPVAKPEERKPGAGRTAGKKADEKKPELSKAEPPKNIDDVRLRINFSYTPWKDVLEWLSKEADLSLVGETMPSGTCNYRDARVYTVAQTIDVLNGLLQLKGFTLVRKERMLFVWDMENGAPPPHIAPLVTPEELDKRGDFELLTCIFSFNKLSPEQVEADVRKLVGPGLSPSVLTNLKQLQVTETGSRLRAIRDIIKKAEQQSSEEDFANIKLEHVTTDEIMGPARQLMAIPEGLTSAPDGSLRIAIRTNGFIVRGKADAVEKFKKLVAELDKDEDGGDVKPPEQPQVVVYPIATSDPDAVLQVLQTVMAGQVGVRIAKDPKTGSIIAHGTPTQHATIKALIDEMQQDKRTFTVIRLKKLDPEEVVAELNKLFGIVEGQNNTNHPKLVANETMKHISVFGSKQQIEQIKAAVIEMGEVPVTNSDPALTIRSSTRAIPLTGRSLNAALDRIQAIAPVYLTNDIRIVKSPAVTDGVGEIPSRVPVPKEWNKKPAKPAANTSSASSSRGEDEDRGYRGFGRGGFRGFGGGDFRGGGGDFRGRGEDRGGGEERRDGERSRDDRSQKTAPAKYFYVDAELPTKQAGESQPTESKQPAAGKEQADDKLAADESAEESAPDKSEPTKEKSPPRQKTTPGAEIVITVTPNGIIVSSEDLDALDKVEEMLLEHVTDDPGKEYTIFKLRYAKADVAADLLSQALSGSSGDDGGGGSVLGDMAGNMFGGGMGGIMSAMMGGGGGSSVISSGPVLLIPDNRLNVILAQGKPGDLDIAEMLLKIIDLPDSGVDVQVVAKPKLIPVYHTTAAEMAETIKQVYANRMVAPAGQGQQQISPQQLMQALAGGRGGRGGRGGGGGGNDRKSEEQKMTVGVDEKTNSLIVSAPPALYEEIKEMVEYLDIASSEKEEFVTTIKTSTNGAMLEEQLNSILGDDVSITRVGGATTSTTSRSNTQRNNNAGRTGNNQNRNQRQGQPQFNPQQFQGFPTGFNGGGGGGRGGQGRGGGGGGRGGR